MRALSLFSCPLLLLPCLLTCNVVVAQETVPVPVPRPQPLPQVVYVPYDTAPDVAVGKQGVMLPYAQFLTLWDKANPAHPEPEKAKPPVGAALTGYALSGQAKGDVAELTLDASITALAEGWSSVTLPAGLALREFTASDKRVLIERDPSGLIVHLPAAGTYTISALLAAPVSKDAAGRRSLAVLAPAAAAGRMELLIADTQADVVVQPAVAVATVNEPGGTRLKAVLGAAAEVVVSWQPPMKATAGEALLLATTEVALTVDERSLKYELGVTLSILRRPITEFTLTLPPECQVLAVEAPGLRTWERDGDRLRLLLHEPVEGTVRAAVKLERLLPAMAPGESRAVSVAWPAVAGAARTTGTVVMLAGEGLSLVVGAHDGLAQIDPAEIKGAASGPVSGAYRHLVAPPPTALVVARLQSELRAVLRQLVHLGADENLITVQLELDVRKAGIFTVVLDVPAAWESGEVTGLAIDDLRTGAVVDGRKRIELALRGRLLGAGTAILRFRTAPSITRSGAAATIDVGLLRLPDARQVRGTLAVALPRSWSLNATTRSGLTGTDAETLRRDSALVSVLRDVAEDDDLPLAFSFLSGPTDRPALTVVAAPRPRELTLRQEDQVTVAEGSVRRTLTWRGEVRFSPLPALRVQVPTSLDERISFAGAGLADHTATERAGGLTTWDLRFQTPVLGAFSVTATITGELPALQSGQPVTVSLPLIKPLDATRLDTLLAIARDGTLDIVVTAAGMESVAPADLPAPLQTAGLIAGFQGPVPVVAELGVTRHDLVRLADGAVTLAHYAAALGDDGVMRVLGQLALTTRGRPWLEVRLPDGAELLEVAVGGRPGRPSRRADGVVVIPLGGSGPDAATLARTGSNGVTMVALVYEVRVLSGQPGVFGSLRVPLPTVGGARTNGGMRTGSGARTAGGTGTGATATDSSVPTAVQPAVAATTAEQAAPLPVERTEVELYLPDGLAVTATGGDLAPQVRGLSVWEVVMDRVQPVVRADAAQLGDPTTDGLTVPVPLHGVRQSFARLGDGGVIELHWWRRGVLDGLSLVVAVSAVLLVWWSRRHGPRLGALALAAAVGLAAASEVWSIVAVGFAGGVALGLVVLAVRWVWTRPRRMSQVAIAGVAAPGGPTGEADPWQVTAQTDAAAPPAGESLAENAPVTPSVTPPLTPPLTPPESRP